MIKKILIILSIFMFQMSLAADVLEGCYKIYPKDADTLFMNAIAALNEDKHYAISEIQSKNGYVLFLHGSKYYLLTLTKRYQNQTEIKVLPQNSEFNEGNSVAQNVFNLIDLKLKTPMELVK